MRRNQTPIDDEDFEWNVKEDTGSVFDIDPSDQDRWCQYIGYKGPGISRISYVRVHHNHITDTELQTAKFLVLPSNPTLTSSPTSVDSSVNKPGSQAVKTIRKLKQALIKAEKEGKFDQLPPYFQNWKYPKAFYEREKQGWKGHYLHRFKHYWEISEKS